MTCPASDLVIGLQCGGSDAFSGVTANPASGYAADLLVRAGATVLFSEVTEVRDAVHLLTPRAVNEEVGRALIREMAWYDRYLERGESDRSANPSPGNKKADWQTWSRNRSGRSRSREAARSVPYLRPVKGLYRKDSFCGDTCKRFCMRHPAIGFWHAFAGIYNRKGNAVRP